MADDFRSLDYDGIAAAFGITRESARQLVMRKRWMRRKGNDGKTRVEVPEDAFEAHSTFNATGHDTGADTSDDTGDVIADTGHDPSNSTGHDTADLSAAVAILERHTGRLEAELATVRARLEAVEGERDTARARAGQVDVLTAVLDIERQRLAEARQDADRWREAATAPPTVTLPWWRRITG